MLLLLFFGAIIIALAYLYLVKHYSYWTDRGVQQGKPKLIFGDSWGNIVRGESPADLVLNVYRKCPGTRYCGMYQFFLPILVIKDPEIIKQILVKDFDHFTDHISFLPEEVDPLWGKNLFSLRGQKWREMRTILSPSFTSSKMRMMFTLMVECGENFIQHFLKKTEDTIILEMKETFSCFTNDVIATTAFGLKVDSLGDPNNEFYLMGKEATNITSFWKSLKFLGYFLCPYLFGKVLNIKLFSDDVSKFFRKVISDTIKSREEKGIVRPDMIHLLMEARKGVQKHEENVLDTGFAIAQESIEVKDRSPVELTDEDITAQALVFFFAGFESVSGLMTFTSYELAINEEIQNRLREEIYATLKECGGKLTYEGLLKMRYMDMVISETLRKWPNAVAVDRTCTKPFTINPDTPDEKPFYVEKGTFIWLPTFAIHRDPEYYPDPEKFDPERFSDENKVNIKPYTYLSFGVGPRVCIGSRFALLETKIVFFNLLLHFHLVPIEKTVIPLKICKNNFFLNSEGGVWLGLKRIKEDQRIIT